MVGSSEPDCMTQTIENAYAICEDIPDDQPFLERAKRLLGAEAVDRAFVRTHSHGVAAYAAELSGFIGMDEARCDRIRFATWLHDIGKLAVPDEVLKFRGKLPPEMQQPMKDHAEAGYILLGTNAPDLVRNIALYHHERYDGNGYFGLKGEDIPLEARIVQIADIHNALMETRDYKTGMSEEAALTLMVQDPEDRSNFGRYMLDPWLMRRFVAMRLHDPEFNAVLTDEGRETLQKYAFSPPMSDFKERLVDGWKIDPLGNRIFKYGDPKTGNEKCGEIRGPTGELTYGPFGPRAEALQAPETDEPQPDTNYDPRKRR